MVPIVKTSVAHKEGLAEFFDSLELLAPLASKNT